MNSISVDFNNVLANGFIRSSRRRLPELPIGASVVLSDDADDKSYEARVVAVDERTVTFDVAWDAQTTEMQFPFASRAVLAAPRATTTQKRTSWEASGLLVTTAA
jgi:hypothetical protein